MSENKQEKVEEFNSSIDGLDSSELDQLENKEGRQNLKLHETIS